MTEVYRSTKTYPHEVGISCCFRQWRAESHCRFLHGYALAFHFVFEASQLDSNGWVVDFGGLKALKESIEECFDHKLAVASDDPALESFRLLQDQGIVDLVVFPDGVGIERFAEFAYNLAVNVLITAGIAWRVKVVSCEVSEHGANSAIYTPGGKA